MTAASPGVEQISEPLAYHGEGPVWSDRWGGLRWVDMLAGDILSLGPDGSVSRRHVASVVACVRPRRQGGAVFGIERGFALEAADGTVRSLAAVLAYGRPVSSFIGRPSMSARISTVGPSPLRRMPTTPVVPMRSCTSNPASRSAAAAVAAVRTSWSDSSGC